MEDGGPGPDSLMLDGNAVGGVLREIFGTEMMGSTTECVHCGRTGPIGELLAFVEAPCSAVRAAGES